MVSGEDVWLGLGLADVLARLGGDGGLRRFVGGGAFVIEHSKRFAPFFVLYSLALSAVLVAVCWWKGEPPRWQWGGDDAAGGKNKRRV